MHWESREQAVAKKTRLEKMMTASAASAELSVEVPGTRVRDLHLRFLTRLTFKLQTVSCKSRTGAEKLQSGDSGTPQSAKMAMDTGTSKRLTDITEMIRPTSRHPRATRHNPDMTDTTSRLEQHATNTMKTTKASNKMTRRGQQDLDDQIGPHNVCTTETVYTRHDLHTHATNGSDTADMTDRTTKSSQMERPT